jgi:hypothetical protein
MFGKIIGFIIIIVILVCLYYAWKTLKGLMTNKEGMATTPSSKSIAVSTKNSSTKSSDSSTKSSDSSTKSFGFTKDDVLGRLNNDFFYKDQNSDNLRNKWAPEYHAEDNHDFELRDQYEEDKLEGKTESDRYGEHYPEYDMRSEDDDYYDFNTLKASIAPGQYIDKMSGTDSEELVTGYDPSVKPAN